MMETERLVAVDPKVHPALGLFHLDNISAALKASSWNVNQEVALLTRIALDKKVNARVSMEAADRIRQIVKESAILHGYIQRLSVSQEHLTDASGHVTTSTRISSNQFLSKKHDDPTSTISMLEAGLEIHKKQPQLNAERRTLRLIPADSADDPNEKEPDNEPTRVGDRVSE